MSTDEHGAPDFSGKPIASTGITMGVKVFIVFSLMLAMFQGALTVGLSPFGKVWPAEDSTKVPLPPANLGTK